MLDFAAIFSSGLTYHDFLARHGTDEHRRRWQGVHEKVVLTAAQRDLLASFSRKLHVLCVAGAWCGDCVNQCPIFDHFAAQNANIVLRFLDRDAAPPELGQALSICGGNRVPVVLFLSEDNTQLGWYGDRTLSKYRKMMADVTGAACPTGLVPEESTLLYDVTQDWLNEFERMHAIVRTSARLRKLHGD